MSEAEDGLMLAELRIAIGGRQLFALSLSISRGEIVTVVGASGSGKSTLLAAIAGTLAPDFSMSGRICLEGRRIDRLPPEARRVGILFQDDLLFPHLSVGGNLAFGLPPGASRSERRRNVEEALAAAGLPGMADCDPATLSGGQRARVSLMRLILSRPRALLLDEPFGRLDAALRGQFRALVFATARARGLPVLLATHDDADAAAAGGRIVSLPGG